jgi:ribose/xylose/arabinose/galactoside ABC-type transport system permease subunit
MSQATATRQWVAQAARRIFFIREFGVVLAAVTIAIFFGVLSDHFFTLGTTANYLQTAVQYGITGIGITMLMIGGEFDLSVGSVYSFAPLIGAWLWLKIGWGIYPAFGVAMGMSLAIGLLNGFVTTKLKIPSFIATLATMFFFKGLALVVTGGYAISYFGSEPLIMALGQASIGPFSVSVIWYVALGAVLTVVLRRLRFGNWVQATGGDREAARSMGVPVDRVKIICFALSASLAGLAGLITFASFGTVTPAQGADLPLIAIVVAVVGGTSLLGGQGSIVGAMVGSVVLGMTFSGLVLIGAPPQWFTSFVGIVLLVAVLVNLRIGAAKVAAGVLKA